MTTRTLLDLLGELGRDLLLRDGMVPLRRDEFPARVHRSAVLSHPSFDTLKNALSADPRLSRLGKEDPIDLGVPFRLADAAILAEALLNAAGWHAHRVGDPSSEEFTGRLEIAVTALHNLIDTGSINGTAFVAYTAHLPPGTRVKTPWGDLRPREPRDDLLIRDIGHDHSPYEGGSIVEAPIEFRWVRTESGQGVKHDGSLHDDRWKQLSLCFLLSLGPEGRRPSTAWLHTSFLPFQAGLGGGGMRTLLWNGATLSEHQVGALRGWMSRMKSLKIPEIALHRTIRIARRGGDAVDKFIDAVIVWEALFGVGSIHELAYRVSMNMACVISRDVEERENLQKEIKKLYRKRSSIVHGGYHAGPAEASDLRNRSRELTMLAWQALLRDHPDLVGAEANDFVSFLLAGGGRRPEQ